MMLSTLQDLGIEIDDKLNEAATGEDPAGEIISPPPPPPPLTTLTQATTASPLGSGGDAGRQKDSNRNCGSSRERGGGTVVVTTRTVLTGTCEGSRRQRIPIMVIPTNEEVCIAWEMIRVLEERDEGQPSSKL